MTSLITAARGGVVIKLAHHLITGDLPFFVGVALCVSACGPWGNTVPHVWFIDGEVKSVNEATSDKIFCQEFFALELFK